MDGSTMTSGLVSTWVTTVDSRGRSHLEAHWRPVPASVPVATAATAAVPAAGPGATHAA
jgi:hypothetical protein